MIDSHPLASITPAMAALRISAGFVNIETGLADVPLGELVRPDEIAALAVHLWSDDAAHLTGAVLNIDGDRTAG